MKACGACNISKRSHLPGDLNGNSYNDDDEKSEFREN